MSASIESIELYETFELKFQDDIRIKFNFPEHAIKIFDKKKFNHKIVILSSSLSLHRLL